VHPRAVAVAARAIALIFAAHCCGTPAAAAESIASPTTQPATQPTTRPAGPTGRNGDYGATYRMPQVIRFSMDRGWLNAVANPPKDLVTGEETAVRIDGSRAFWTVRAFPATSADEDPTVELTYRDRGEPTDAGHCTASLQSRGGYLAISGFLRADGNGNNGELVYVLYRAWREAEMVQLEVYQQENGELSRTLLTARGPSMLQMWATHPFEMERYVAPVLKKLTRRNVLGPGPADVYAAFPAIRSDAQAFRRLAAILPDLDDPDATKRDAASAKLFTLGRPGVLCAMRIDPKLLTPEQSARLEDFIDAHRRRPGAKAVKPDGPFLLDCLEDDDSAVRVAAKRELERLTNQSFVFDAAGEGDARLDGLRAIRRAVEQREAKPMVFTSIAPEN
jgi:hypothetical protein